jgi:hypothetical protein
MKKIGAALCALILFGLASSAWAENETIVFGKNKAFTAFNYSDPRVGDDPDYPALGAALPYADASIFGPGNAMVIADFNQAGTAYAAVGVDFNWDLGGRTWDEVKNETVIVRFEFTFNLNSSFTVGSGSTFSGVSFNGNTVDWHEVIGGGTGNMSSTDTISSAFQTTVEGLDNMGRRLSFYAFAEAACTLANTTNAASADFDLVRITIEFPNIHQKKGGGCMISEPAEPERFAALLLPGVFLLFLYVASRLSLKRT